MTPPKPLTEAEHAAVDAAIAAGRFQRIPLGVYAECQINPVPVREQIRRQANYGKASLAKINRDASADRAERTEQARAMLAEGKTAAEIATRLNVTRSAVYGYLNRVPA